jgi:hypothetical protein
MHWTLKRERRASLSSNDNGTSSCIDWHYNNFLYSLLIKTRDEVAVDFASRTYSVFEEVALFSPNESFSCFQFSFIKIDLQLTSCCQCHHISVCDIFAKRRRRQRIKRDDEWELDKK